MKVGDRRHQKIIVLENIKWMDRDFREVLRYLMRAMLQDCIAFILILWREELDGL